MLVFTVTARQELIPIHVEMSFAYKPERDDQVKITKLKPMSVKPISPLKSGDEDSSNEGNLGVTRC